MSFTTPADGVPCTDAEADDITAWLHDATNDTLDDDLAILAVAVTET